MKDIASNHIFKNTDLGIYKHSYENTGAHGITATPFLSLLFKIYIYVKGYEIYLSHLLFIIFCVII